MELKSLKKTKKSASTQMVIETRSLFSQTDPNPDIPYNVAEPLPPIFSSMVVKFNTPKINFPKQWSMPELSKIAWGPDDEYEPPPFLDERLDWYDSDAEVHSSSKDDGDE